jgi:cobalt-zinc-cadmium resistance protein CzcA
VLVTFIKQQLEAGEPFEMAVRKGCLVRLRPVLMTASITVFSLIPMLLAAGPGAEVQRPLGTVVGGLFTSTLATLLVLPAMYGWFDRRETEMPL